MGGVVKVFTPTLRCFGSGHRSRAVVCVAAAWQRLRQRRTPSPGDGVATPIVVAISRLPGGGETTPAGAFADGNEPPSSEQSLATSM
jgi:hypothetical protein